MAALGRPTQKSSRQKLNDLMCKCLKHIQRTPFYLVTISREY